jgi:hypothetical protein
MEDSTRMNKQNDVDVTILINTYSQKLSFLANENIILETRIQSLLKDFEEERKKLLEKISELENNFIDGDKY